MRIRKDKYGSNAITGNMKAGMKKVLASYFRNEDNNTTRSMDVMKNRISVLRIVANSKDNWLTFSEIHSRTKISSPTNLKHHLDAIVEAHFFISKNGVYRLNPRIDPEEINHRHFLAYLAWLRGEPFYRKWLRNTRKKAKGNSGYESWLAEFEGFKMLIPKYSKVTDPI